MSIETDEQFLKRIISGWEEREKCVISHAGDRDRLLTLARRGAAVQWRPIEEAPKDGTPILGCFGRVMATVSFRYGDFSLIECGRYAEDGVWWPDHWMPLPPPPAKETRDE